MTRTNTPDEDVEALNQRLSQDGEPPIRRHKTEADATTRLDVPKHRVGPEVPGDGRASEESETSDAIKRVAETDGRV